MVYSRAERVGVAAVYQTFALEPGTYELSFESTIYVWTNQPGGGAISVYLWEGAPDFSNIELNVLWKNTWTGLSSYTEIGSYAPIGLVATFTVTVTQPEATIGFVMRDEDSAYWYVWRIKWASLRVISHAPLESEGAEASEAGEAAEGGLPKIDLLAMLTKLRNDTVELVEKKGLEESLVSKVDAAIKQAEEAINELKEGKRDWSNRLSTIQNQLAAFMNEIEAIDEKIGEGVDEYLTGQAQGICSAIELIKAGEAELVV